MPSLALAAFLATTAASPQAARPPTAGTVLHLAAHGAQVYACQRVDAPPAWRLLRPEARLADEQGHVLATHGAGPSWRALDGSAIEGAVIGAMPAPGPGAIPWLALRVTRRTGSGLFGRVVMVARVQTEGGVAPATGCDAAHLGATISIPYRATYLFVAG